MTLYERLRLLVEILTQSREDAIFYGVLLSVIAIGMLYSLSVIIRLFREE